MAVKGTSEDSGRRNRLGLVRKLFACFFGVLFFLGLIQSAGAQKAIQLRGWCTITAPDFIPDFSKWRSRFTTVFAHPSLFIFYVEAINPDNPFDYLMFYVAHEVKDDRPEEDIIVAIGKSLISEYGGLSSPRVAADQKYLQTGIPSFEFTEVSEFPKLDSLIAIKIAESFDL